MKIALAQLNFHVGNFEANKRKMLDAIKEAKDQSADIICFPELATTAYPPRDFLEFEDFIKKSDAVVDSLADAARGIAVVVGAPVRNPVPEGKDLYNAALFLHEGKRLHEAHKTLLPTYDIFDEYRYFEPGDTFNVVEYHGYKIGLTICEDIWNIGNDNPLYTTCPMDEIEKHKPDFILNLSASPFDTEHAQERIDILTKNVERYELPFFYVNHVGAQTEIIFDGGSIVMNQKGTVCDEMPYFEEMIKVYDLKEVKTKVKSKPQDKMKIALIQDALIVGIQEYFRKLGFSKAILGLSGGLDSAVTATLAAKALGASNVTAILMPSRFSSDHSVNDSLELVDNLGIKSETVPIHKAYNTLLAQLHPLFQNRPFDVTEENIQARIRCIILMAMSNKFGHILLNTTNKSEMAVGYGTLYGDLAGSISVLGDVYKTEVYALARYLNRDEILIPQNILDKPPSAELRPDQKDSDSLPDYDILDRILYKYIEKQQDPEEIIKEGFDPRIVRRVLRLVNMNEFKRYQTAPTLRVSSKAFGMGRRMPIVAKYLS